MHKQPLEEVTQLIHAKVRLAEGYHSKTNKTLDIFKYIIMSKS